ATGYQPAHITFDKSTGVYSMRLPSGGYYVSGLAVQPAAGHFPGSRAAEIAPTVPVTGDKTLVLDGRTTDPVVTTVDHPGAAPVLQYLEIDQAVAGADFGDA